MSTVAHDTIPFDPSWTDRYEVVRQLGRGGFATVYEALDRHDGCRVAVKVVPAGRALSERVAREVEAAAGLDHPNVVALRDWFSDGRRHVLVWELVDGEPLDRLAGVLDDVAVVRVGEQLLDALACAHERRIVHRDVKPQNVMVTRDGRVKVMDFGIARLLDADTLTRDGDVVGTVAYMSPEQARTSRVGPKSDVYSAGIVLYELLAGVNPLRGATPAETLSNVVAGRLPSLAAFRPDLPAALVRLIDRACAPEPARRPTAAALAAALAEVRRSGVLDGGRLARLQAALLPALRLGPTAGRLLGAFLAAAAVQALTGLLPSYPEGWRLPLLAVAAGAWLVAPAAGLAVTAGLLAFPVFDVSLPLGVAYLVAAAAVTALARRRPLLALWPVLALLLVPSGLALAAAAAAAAAGRWRGPLTAAWAAAVTYLVLTVRRVADSPFTLGRPRPRLAAALLAADDPLAAAGQALRLVVSPPCLMQAGLWAGLALLVWLAARRRAAAGRLWLWSLAFSLAAVVLFLGPSLLGLRPSASPGLLGWSVGAAAAVVLLPLLLVPPRGRPEDGDDGHLPLTGEEA